MSKSITEALVHILGRENVLTGSREIISRYFRNRVNRTGIIAVTPKNVKAVQRIVSFAIKTRIPIYTLGGMWSPEEIASNKGILLDLSKMNRIYEIDPVNLHAIIGPGVTFSQFQEKVKKYEPPVKIAFPVCADSPFILCNYMNRNITLNAPTLRGRTIIVSNYHVVLPDSGDIFKSGSHSISEQDHVPDWPGTGGTAPSLAFYGTDDALGIPVKGVVWLFPVQEHREVILFRFPDHESVNAFLFEHCRAGRFVEAYGANQTFLSALLAKNESEMKELRKEIPEWIVAGTLEGSEELVTVIKEILITSAKKFNGQIFSHELLCSTFDKPWYVWDRNKYKGHSEIISFYCLFSRFEQLKKVLTGELEHLGYSNSEVGQLVLPLKQARSLYAEFDLYFEDKEEGKNIYIRAYKKVIDAGAFVDRPAGSIAEYVYSKNPEIWKLQREVKRQLDPHNILNPHQFIARRGGS